MLVFLQDNFDFLCSDLSTFKIARAVTASSAVPVVFDPIVLDNYDGCGIVKPEWLLQAESRSKNDPRLRSTVRTINGYLDKESHRYIHLVDGGITDNLGVRPLHTGLSLLGSENMATQLRFKNFPSKVIFVVVDASTNKGSGLGLSRKTPSLRNTISAVTNAQLHRYNTETIELIRQSLSEWAGAKSTSENPISTYYVQVSLDNIEDPEERRYFNGIPTSFSLTDEQVDGLIEIGGRLLRKDPELRRLLEEMNIGRTL